MIKSLYPCFQHWASKGSIYIISDTHFDDSNTLLIDPNWPEPEEYMKKLSHITKNDTLIHLGDVGNPKYFNQLKCHKVLIMGNHSRGKSYYTPYFDEVYEGPLFISDRILLSHEPIEGLPWCINIHGHNHNGKPGIIDDGGRHINVAANVYNYMPFSLGLEIKRGILSGINNIHRITIDEATERKQLKYGE